MEIGADIFHLLSVVKTNCSINTSHSIHRHFTPFLMCSVVWCFLCFKVLLHQARASTDRRAVDTQTGVTFENTQHARVFPRLGSGKRWTLSWTVSHFISLKEVDFKGVSFCFPAVRMKLWSTAVWTSSKTQPWHSLCSFKMLYTRYKP